MMDDGLCTGVMADLDGCAGGVARRVRRRVADGEPFCVATGIGDRGSRRRQLENEGISTRFARKIRFVEILANCQCTLGIFERRSSFVQS